ncbi:MAG: ACT domain-containing protein [Deltaproteobacteria bacterium]|nr:ACT domain-containing protein [Deltaproteobacteria bacterium]
METLKQLAVFVANRPGTLAQVCHNLSENGVNILGLSVADAVDHAVLRFVVDKSAVALHVLGEAGLLVVDSDIIAIQLPNRPGQLSDLGRIFSDAGVNIEYAYGGMAAPDRAGTLFVKVSDLDRAREALRKLGL